MRILNAGVKYYVEADKITSNLWNYIKAEFPSKYRKIQSDILAWGIDKVKVGFAEGLRPVWVTFSC